MDCHYSEHLCSPQPRQPGQHKWVNEAAHYAYVITPALLHCPTLQHFPTMQYQTCKLEYLLCFFGVKMMLIESCG